jgi:hypothetical protein
LGRCQDASAKTIGDAGDAIGSYRLADRRHPLERTERRRLGRRLHLLAPVDVADSLHRFGTTRGLGLIGRTDPLLWLGRFAGHLSTFRQDSKTPAVYGRDASQSLVHPWAYTAKRSTLLAMKRVALLLGILLLGFPLGCNRSLPKAVPVDAGTRVSSLASLVLEELDGELQSSPTQASWLGDHSSDDRLDDVRIDAIWREVARLGSMQDRVQRFAEGLTPPLPTKLDLAAIPDGVEKDSQRLDTLLLLARIESLRFEREELRPHERSPLYYAELVAWGLDGLATSNLATSSGLRALRGRLQAVPLLLKEAQRNLKNPPELWTKRAIEVTQQTRDFVATVLPRLLVRLRGPDSKQSDEVARLREEAQRALEDYITFLSRDLLPRSKGEWTLPRERLLVRLRALELLDVPIETVLAAAEQEHERSREQAEELARDISEYQSASRAMSEALREIEEDHPKPEELATTVEQSLHRVYELLADGSGLPVPVVRPRVVEMAPYRFGYLQLLSAAPLEPDREPLLQYDPVDVNWKDKRQISEHLRMLNRSQIMVTVLRDVAPGRLAHQLILRQKQGSLSQLRQRGHSLALVEGWPLYATQQAISLFPKGATRDHLQLLFLRHRLVQLGRLIVALRLHVVGSGAAAVSQRMEDAIRFLAEDCYLDEHAARREVERGTYEPLYGLAALGALQLTQLRDDYKAQQGESYSQSSFHEAVLSAGLLPVSVLRKLLLRNPSPSLRPPPSSSGSPSK